jgi:hypothetical protein
MLEGARVADAVKVLTGVYPYIEKGYYCALRFKRVNALKTDELRRIRMFK